MTTDSWVPEDFLSELNGEEPSATPPTEEVVEEEVASEEESEPVAESEVEEEVEAGEDAETPPSPPDSSRFSFKYDKEDVEIDLNDPEQRAKLVEWAQIGRASGRTQERIEQAQREAEERVQQRMLSQTTAWLQQQGYEVRHDPSTGQPRVVKMQAATPAENPLDAVAKQIEEARAKAKESGTVEDVLALDDLRAKHGALLAEQKAREQFRQWQERAAEEQRTRAARSQAEQQYRQVEEGIRKELEAHAELFSVEGGDRLRERIARAALVKAYEGGAQWSDVVSEIRSGVEGVQSYAAQIEARVREAASRSAKRKTPPPTMGSGTSANAPAPKPSDPEFMRHHIAKAFGG